jgi:hypothetical protein
MRQVDGCLQRIECSGFAGFAIKQPVDFSSIERHASRIACALFALAPIIPPSPLGLIRSQNQVLALLQTAKSTPKYRLRSHEFLLTVLISSVHLRIRFGTKSLSWNLRFDAPVS